MSGRVVRWCDGSWRPARERVALLDLIGQTADVIAARAITACPVCEREAGDIRNPDPARWGRVIEPHLVPAVTP